MGATRPENASRRPRRRSYGKKAGRSAQGPIRPESPKEHAATVPPGAQNATWAPNQEIPGLLA